MLENRDGSELCFMSFCIKNYQKKTHHFLTLGTGKLNQENPLIFRRVRMSFAHLYRQHVFKFGLSTIMVVVGEVWSEVGLRIKPAGYPEILRVLHEDAK